MEKQAGSRIAYEPDAVHLDLWKTRRLWGIWIQKRAELSRQRECSEAVIIIKLYLFVNTFLKKALDISGQMYYLAKE